MQIRSRGLWTELLGPQICDVTSLSDLCGLYEHWRQALMKVHHFCREVVCRIFYIGKTCDVISAVSENTLCLRLQMTAKAQDSSTYGVH